jgi:hypothetical protein
MKIGAYSAIVAVLGLGAASGCATTFTGDAYVPDGATGCKSACSAQGLEMVGMVIMGEYSDGCICKVRREAASGNATEELAVQGAATAAVGVVSAMRASAQQRHAHQH